MKKKQLGFLASLWRIFRPYWRSPEKRFFFFFLALLVTLKLSHVYVLVRFNEWRSIFYNALQNQDKSAFFSALGDWGIFTALFMVLSVYELYLQQRLEIRWRTWLTETYLKDWLSQQAYYLLEMLEPDIDNPDQRLSEDIRLFVSSVLTLSLDGLKALVTLASFLVILWDLSGTLDIPLQEGTLVLPGYMVWAAILYALAGSWITERIGHRLVGLNVSQQHYEANFRHALLRIRAQSEGIAFYQGEKNEKGALRQVFQNIVNNYRALIGRQKKLSWFTSGHWQISMFFPYLVASPRFFSGQLSLGGLIQTTAAFTQVENALCFFIHHYAALAELKAVCRRLNGFLDALEQVQASPAAEGKLLRATAPADQLQVQSLCLTTPAGEPLLHNLSLQLQAGDHLLITGPSGCGKSTFFKTLSGLWPFSHGQLSLPPADMLLFLPQKPYLPVGTLRAALAYPQPHNKFSDTRLREVLRQCQLENWATHLDAADAWEQTLSPGEQQRLAFARALLQQPRWLFLDEATSALDAANEEAMYRLLHAQLPQTTLISISHRQALAVYHRLQLRLSPSGQWKLAA
ncbi:ABC transporter ATP-binding protein/permease [Anaeroarcus burkinensis]|uniref:ABC transporter ATP-binding protein/permease n=1 Tax=Anaeroarcus burkinensis TaxID=82376 RepID=UPI000410FB6A|nr:ABC transporter ATP-binding protein/permease [Anaeroarcus burkinensis]